jgi:hypothetical protein
MADDQQVAGLVEAGQLRPQAPDRQTLLDTLELAERDLEAAEENAGRFALWAETMIYEAGLRAARVIVMAAGYRIAAERGHVTAINAADALTEEKLHRIFLRLHRLRRRRAEFMYESTSEPGAQELATATDDARRLIAVARERLKGALDQG